MNAYQIGPLTAQHVFKAANLTSMSGMQAVMDAVEVALERVEQIGYEDGMKDGGRHILRYEYR